MPITWSNLQEYKCPICASILKEKDTKHECSSKSCSFRISDEKLSNLVVLRHKPLDPPEFIKELRKENKDNFIIKLCKNMWKR